MNNHATLRAEHEIDGWQMTPPPLTTNDLCQGGPLSTARCCVMVQGKTQRLHFSGILTSSVLRRPPLVSSNNRAKAPSTEKRSFGTAVSGLSQGIQLPAGSVRDWHRSQAPRIARR